MLGLLNMTTYLQLVCILTVVCNVYCVELFPFGDSVGDTRLASSDDGSSSRITLQDDFPFYDANQRRLYVNNNGLLSFITPARAFSDLAFPINAASRGSRYSLIAPFWGDVDTSGPSLGAVWYRQSDSPSLIQSVKSKIVDHMLLYPEVNISQFEPTFVFIATWDHVGFYQRQGDKRNTFQCVLVTDGHISFVLFLYADEGIQWTTGDSSGGVHGLGGTPAQVGFNAGDGIRSLTLPLSQTDDVRDIDHLPGNTGEQGLWIFRVDKEVIGDGNCNDEGPIILLPNKGSSLGGLSLAIIGPCFNTVEYLTCTFSGSLWSVTVNGTRLDGRRALCIVPPLKTTGQIMFRLNMKGGGVENSTTKTAKFYSLPPRTSTRVNFVGSDLLFRDGSTLTLTWMPKDVFPQKPPSSYNVDISIFALVRTNTSASWKKLRTISRNTPNWGTAATHLPELKQMEKDKFPIAFQVSVTEASIPDGLPSPPGIWTDVAYYSEDDLSRQSCINWIENTNERMTEKGKIDEQPSCPCTLQQAQILGSGVVIDNPPFIVRDYLNKGAHRCGYQLLTINDGSTARRQCCYDTTGYLLPGSPSGGHSALVHPDSQQDQPLNALIEHFEKDIVPFLDCCKSRYSLCSEYYRFRPSTTSSCASLHNTPGVIFGDPHFVTFDTFKYTFNGRGEFTLVDTSDALLRLQGRFTEALDHSGRPAVATVLSAIVIKSDDEDLIQFEISRRGIKIIVNGDMLPFEEHIQKIILNKAVLTKEGSDTFSIRYNSGVEVKVQKELEYISVAEVSLPAIYANKTRGLLGNFNGNSFDDLIPKQFATALPTASSLIDIHEGFGLSWIIGNPEESLFTYRSFQTFRSFFLPEFSAELDPSFRSSYLEAEAIELCGEDDEFCLFDVATTGRLAIGNATKAAGEMCEVALELTHSIVCDPPCDHGVCVSNNTCKCQPGYEGLTCDRIVLVDSCFADICVKRGSCRKLGEDTLCVCSPYRMGFNCEKSTTFEIDCTSSVSSGMLSVQCNASQPIKNSICTIDKLLSEPCSFPWSVDITSCSIFAGSHRVKVDAVSVVDQRATTEASFEVAPVGLRCDGGIDKEHIVIHGCDSNNKIERMECAINGLPKQQCELPIDTDLTSKPPGMYTLNITVVDVYQFRDDFVIQYTKPSLRIDLINSSPRVSGNSTMADFRTNRPKGTYSVKCYLSGQDKTDCSSGHVNYVGLSSGTYTFRIVATATDGGRYILRRRVYIGDDDSFCSVQLINSGVQVEGQSVSIHFIGSNAAAYFLCRLDDGYYQHCRSPHRLTGVARGPHRIQVKPVCNNKQQKHRISQRFIV